MGGARGRLGGGAGEGGGGTGGGVLLLGELVALSIFASRELLVLSDNTPSTILYYVRAMGGEGAGGHTTRWRKPFIVSSLDAPTGANGTVGAAALARGKVYHNAAE